MSTFPLPLLAGETILKQDEKTLYVKNALGIGYNILYGKLWLTSARLVHQDFPLGRITAYPLSHVTNAEHETINIAHRKFAIKGVYESWVYYNAALMIAFDNNGMDYFIPQDIAGWAQAITQAIPAAPVLAYTQIPPLRPSLKADLQSVGPSGAAKQNPNKMFGILLAVIIIFICAVTSCVFFPFLMVMIQPGGS